MSSVSGKPKIKVTEENSLSQELSVWNKGLKNLYLLPHPGYLYPDFYISLSRLEKWLEHHPHHQMWHNHPYPPPSLICFKAIPWTEDRTEHSLGRIKDSNEIPRCFLLEMMLQCYMTTFSDSDNLGNRQCSQSMLDMCGMKRCVCPQSKRAEMGCICLHADVHGGQKPPLGIVPQESFSSFFETRSLIRT